MITLQDCIAMCDRRARAHPGNRSRCARSIFACARARRRDEDMLRDDIRAALRRHDSRPRTRAFNGAAAFPVDRPQPQGPPIIPTIGISTSSASFFCSSDSTA